MGLCDNFMNRLIQNIIINESHYNRLYEKAMNDNMAVNDIICEYIELGLNNSFNTMLWNMDRVKKLENENKILWDFIESKGFKVGDL